MGLRLFMSASQNRLAIDVDAYWRVENLMYSPDQLAFQLTAYPSRECALKEGSGVIDSVIPFGSPYSPVDGVLHVWRVETEIVKVFPQGIPLDPDAQKTAIYNWLKSYTGVPFKDVFEE